MCNIWGQLIFNFAIENPTRSSLRFGKFFNGIGADGVGVNFLFFCVSLSCLYFACVFALFLFHICFFRLFSDFFLFLCSSCFSLFFFVFPLFSIVFHCFSLFFFVFLCFSLFFSVLFPFFVSFYSCQKILVFSAHCQAVAVDCPAVFGYRETAKTRRKGNFAPTPSAPTPSETFRAMLLF